MQLDTKNQGRYAGSSREEPDYFDILKNKINIENVPFTDRSSRILLFKDPSASSLHIRISERMKRDEERIGHYRVRPHFISNLVLTDGTGAPLDFRLTTYPHKLMLETDLGTVQIAYSDPETLFFLLPQATIGIRFQIRAGQAKTDRRGGTLKGWRNAAYTTDARILSNTINWLDEELSEVHLVLDSKQISAISLNITPRLGYNRQIHAEEVIPKATASWRDWFAQAPKVTGEYQRQYYYAWWIMRSAIIGSRFYLTREAMLPSKVHYVGVWHWDAFFHAITYSMVDRKLAEDQVRIVLDHQLPNGMVPDCVHDEGIVAELKTPCEGAVTKPPIIAWAVLKMYERTGNKDFLEEIYEPLCRWNRWWFEYNDDDHDGLPQYNHPFSSGLDDSPLWDYGMPVVSPELNTYLFVQMESLAKIAIILGEEEDAVIWRERAERLVGVMVDRLWDQERGIFQARKMESGQLGSQVPVLTPFNLFPLWTGRLDKDMSDRLVKHLTDPEEFWTKYPAPTVAKCDPAYNPNIMWRGPVWINANYMLIEALERSGYTDIARALALKTLDLVNSYDDIVEYYNPETGQKPPKAAPMFGWSAALFIDLTVRYGDVGNAPHML